MQPVKDRCSFSAQERIKSTLIIKSIFEKKQSCKAFPIKCFYRVVKGATPLQLAVVVSKRRFKHAVDRNRVKRLMRESFRLQKHIIPKVSNITIQMCWLYMDNTLPDSKTMMNAGQQLLLKLKNELFIHENNSEFFLQDTVSLDDRVD